MSCSPPLAPGDVVMAGLLQAHGRNRGATTPHPCAVVHVPLGGRTLLVARMTTTRVFAGAGPRPAIPDWKTIGLHYPSFWWSRVLVPLNIGDVHHEIGRLTARAWASLLENHALPQAA